MARHIIVVLGVILVVAAAVALIASLLSGCATPRERPLFWVPQEYSLGSNEDCNCMISSEVMMCEKKCGERGCAICLEALR